MVLELYQLVEVIKKIVEKKTPFLGICLGLQLLFDESEESPGVKGLGILKGKIVEMRLEGEIIRVKINVGGIILCSDITVSAEKELNLNIGKEVYVGFKAMSVATLKL